MIIFVDEQKRVFEYRVNCFRGFSDVGYFYLVLKLQKDSIFMIFLVEILNWVIVFEDELKRVFENKVDCFRGF